MWFTAILSCVAEYLAVDDFPEHIKSLVQKEIESEEQEKRQREIERNTCKVGAVCAQFRSAALPLNLNQFMYYLVVSVWDEFFLFMCSLLSDQALLHASCEDDDGEQAGSAQGQNSERSNRDGL